MEPGAALGRLEKDTEWTALGQKALSFTFGQKDTASHPCKPLLFCSLIGLLLMLGLLHQRLKQGPGRGCEGSREGALTEKPRGQQSKLSWAGPASCFCKRKGFFHYNRLANPWLDNWLLCNCTSGKVPMASTLPWSPEAAMWSGCPKRKSTGNNQTGQDQAKLVSWSPKAAAVSPT